MRYIKYKSLPIVFDEYILYRGYYMQEGRENYIITDIINDQLILKKYTNSYGEKID